MNGEWRIRYKKAMLATAAERGKELFAVGYVGYVGYVGKGRGEAFMYLDNEQATTLWCMAHEINGGKTAREALEIVEGRIAEHRAEMSAKAEGVTA